MTVVFILIIAILLAATTVLGYSLLRSHRRTRSAELRVKEQQLELAAHAESLARLRDDFDREISE